MDSSASGDTPHVRKHFVVHFILLVIFSGIATTAVILRFWARKITNQALALNDYLVLIGLIFALAETGVNAYGCCYPARRQAENVPLPLGLELLFLSPILWAAAVTIIRAAILSLYTQIFPRRGFIRTCYVVLAVNIIFGVSTIVADCLICRPITYRWGPLKSNGSCGDQNALDMSVAVLNTLQDVVIVIMPMPILWGLQITRSKKMALSFVFGIGIVICAITIYRVTATSTISYPAKENTPDTYCLIALLTSLEVLLGVICACLPFFKPLLAKLRGSMGSRETDTIKSFRTDSIPVALSADQLPRATSQRHDFSEHKSPMDSSWCEKGIQGHHDQVSA